MKVKVTESKIGVEYIADVISSCDQNGIECIVDDKSGDIYYYDPKRHKYGDDKLLQNNDTSIWEIVKDKQLFDATLFDASGAIFKDFAVRWNDLQKKGDEDEVFKTDHCNPIRGNFSEKARNIRKPTAKDREEFEKFRKRWKSLGKKKDDSEEEEDYVDEFGLRVNGIEAQVSEGYEDDPRDWSASEGEVEIVWTTNQYEDFGIFEGDTSTYVIDYDRVEDQEDLINEVCRLIGKEYPDLDFEVDDFEITNEKEFWSNRKGGEKELADGTTEIEGIPDWAASYLVNGDDSGLSEEDKADVDRYVDDLASEGLALAHPIEGTENEFDRYPAFGKACATSTWIANEI